MRPTRDITDREAPTTALVVGIDDYANDHPRLRHAVEEARAYVAMLHEAGEVEARLRTDGAATRGELYEDIIWLSMQAALGRRTVLYFAGHGAYTRKLGYRLCPVDTRRDLQNTLSADEVWALLRPRRTRYAPEIHLSCGSTGEGPRSRTLTPGATVMDTTFPTRGPSFAAAGAVGRPVLDDPDTVPLASSSARALSPTMRAHASLTNDK